MPVQALKSGMEINGKYVELKAMNTQEMQTTLDEWVHAAKMARLAGFDGVEIHGANGYLIE